MIGLNKRDIKKALKAGAKLAVYYWLMFGRILKLRLMKL